MGKLLLAAAGICALAPGCGAAPPIAHEAMVCSDPCHASLGADGTTPEAFYRGDVAQLWSRQIAGACSFTCAYLADRLHHEVPIVADSSRRLYERYQCPPTYPEQCRPAREPPVDTGLDVCSEYWRSVSFDESQCIGGLRDSGAGDHSD